jgi:hypothetical protein
MKTGIDAITSEEEAGLFYETSINFNSLFTPQVSGRGNKSFLRPSESAQYQPNFNWHVHCFYCPNVDCSRSVSKSHIEKGIMISLVQQ